VGCETWPGSPKTEAQVGRKTRIRIRREVVWCLFGVCFWRAPESTSETQETIETSLKRRKIKELFSNSFNARDLRYGADENPSLSAINNLEPIQGCPPFRRLGSLGHFRIHPGTVRSEISKLGIVNSPSIRGAPQVRFSATIRKMRSRTSRLVGFLPARKCLREILFQCSLNPVRCQLMTVPGFFCEGATPFASICLMPRRSGICLHWRERMCYTKAIRSIPRGCFPVSLIPFHCLSRGQLSRLRGCFLQGKRKWISLREAIPQGLKLE
jgi:hypothetical protein